MSIKRNTAYNLAGPLAGLAVSLVTVPLYLQVIGDSRFGVLAIAWLVLGYFGLFDLGLGQAVAQRIAAQRNEPESERADTFWSAILLSLGFSLIGCIVAWPVATYFFDGGLSIGEGLRGELHAVIPWFILMLPTAMLSGLLAGALQGRERFAELTKLSIAGMVLFQSLPLIAVASSRPSLDILLPTALGARFITMLALLAECKTHVFGNHAPKYSRKSATALVRYGVWTSMSSIISPLMTISDRFVIGAISGAQAVSRYSVPYQLAERTAIFSGAIATTLFPRFAIATHDERHRLTHQGLLALAVVMTPAVGVGVLFTKPFLALWISREFSESTTLVAQIVLLGYWVNGFARIPFVRLQAIGRPDVVAKCHLVELPIYFALLYVGLVRFGVVGAAIAFNVRVLADFAMLATFAGITKRTLSVLLVPSACLTAAFATARAIPFGTSVWWVLAGTNIIAMLAWSWHETPVHLKELKWFSRLFCTATKG